MTVADETIAGLPESDRVFRIEQHGIDRIGSDERWAKPRDLCGMWAGASLQIEYFVYGVILMTFGFTFAQAVIITVLGNLSYVFLGLASLQGPQAGTTAMTINRASYGSNGSRLIALFNWLTQVGFETEGLILVVFAAEALAIKAGFLPGTATKVVFIIIAVAIQLLLPLLGHATMVKTLRVLIVPFVILFAVLAGLTLGKAHLNAVTHGAGWSTFMAGLAFTIAVAGLGWTENGNDYSRYLPLTAKKRSIIGWIFLGTAVPEILVMTLGAAVATYAPGLSANDPFQVFTTPHVHVFATWFVVPFLVVAVFQLFAINSLDLYSSGVTLQALGARVKRWQAVAIDTVIACGLTIYAVFDSSFSTLLKDFVDLVIVWIAPWFAIYLVDWALRHYRYVPAELQRVGRDGLYWANGGVRWGAIAAELLGMLAALEGLSTTIVLPHILNEIPLHTSGADFSIFTGIFVAGLSYAVLAGPSVRRQAARQDEILASSPA